MKLSDAELRTGDVLLFQGQSVAAWAVKLRTHSRYSHAGIVIKIRANGTERVSVLEALEPYGVRLYPLDHYVASGAKIDWFQIVDQAMNRDAVAAFGLKQWGLRYGWASLWWHFSRLAWLLTKIFGIKPRPDPERWFCSQLVADALRHGGFKMEGDAIAVGQSPGDVSYLTCLHRMGELTP